MSKEFYIQGSVSDNEIKVLFDLASLSKDIIVEIGGFQGRTSIQLAKGSQKGNNKKVYVIDPWTNVKVVNTKDIFINKNIFLENIKSFEVDNIIIPIQGYSSEIIKTWNKKIGMLFIDGDHSYNGVKKDIEWIQYVIKGGTIAFHDYVLPKYKNSVVRAIDEVRDTLNFKTQIDSLIIFEKI